MDMVTYAEPHPLLGGPDRALLDSVAAFGRRLRQTPELYADFCSLERAVAARLCEQAALARAVAEANATLVELRFREEEQTDALRRKTALLEQQNEIISRQRAELERDARRAAEATVEAVFELDEREDRIADLSGERERLTTLNRELEGKAFVDGLTGLFNHRYFEEQLQLELSRARRYGRPLSLLFVDADHFKNINDTLGHDAGDDVLRGIARVLSRIVRAADIPVRFDASPFAVRYGGEEFVVILPETGLEGALCAGERVREGIFDADLPGGASQPLGRVTVSVGAASLRATDDARSLIKRADEALYGAKRSGRNRVFAEESPP